MGTSKINDEARDRARDATAIQGEVRMMNGINDHALADRLGPLARLRFRAEIH